MSSEILKRIRRGENVPIEKVQSLFGLMKWSNIQGALDEAENRQARLQKTRRNVYSELKKKFSERERQEHDREIMERENDAARMTRMVERDGINQTHLGKFVRKMREFKEKERRRGKNTPINTIAEKAFRQTKQDLGLVSEEERVKPRRLPKSLRNAAKTNATTKKANNTKHTKTQKRRK